MFHLLSKTCSSIILSLEPQICKKKTFIATKNSIPTVLQFGFMKIILIYCPITSNKVSQQCTVYLQYLFYGQYLLYNTFYKFSAMGYRYFQLPQASLEVQLLVRWSVGHLCEKVTFTRVKEYQIVIVVTLVTLVTVVTVVTLVTSKRSDISDSSHSNDSNDSSDSSEKKIF